MQHGKLYEVDMRLRPSGNKGPIATSLASFRRYHAAESWTWERMALTRARVVAGPGALAARFEVARRAALARAVPAATIRADAVAMRRRLADAFPSDRALDVKHRAGGLMELEFIAQALQLIAASADPGAEPSGPSTAAMFAGLAEAGLVGRDEAAALSAIGRRWRAAISLLRLSASPAATPDEMAAPLAEALCRAVLGARAIDRTRLAAQMEQDAAMVRAAFERHLGALPAQ